MDLTLELTLKQKQELVLTQSLIQSLNVLRMNSGDIDQMINEAFLSNPVLEYAPAPAKKSTEGDISGLIENIADTPKTFTDDLLEQLRYSYAPGYLKSACEYLIGSLDERGYLTMTTEEIADALLISKDEVSKAEALLRSFDPAGTGARTLEECLLLQIKRLGLLTPDREFILLNHLKELALENYGALGSVTDMTEEELKEFLELIRTLEPSPCNYFDSQLQTAYIVPDLILKEKNGEYILFSNEKATPHLRLSSRYTSMDLTALDEKDREFIQEKIRRAKELINSINYRNETIYKIGLAITNHQMDFFTDDAPLKPLTLKTIADEAGVHISTVSRTVNGKFLSTPKGTFELKKLFAGKIKNGDFSPQYVKKRIVELIDREDPSKPLRDQKRSDILASEGTPVSRRAVAKYRDELHIYSSRERKK